MVFHSDLDNTLIYSYKHEIGTGKKCVEIYQGREISFMTAHSAELLRRVRAQAVFVPTTTRTVEQYQRIRLGEEPPEYALVCNGGVLLVHGERDAGWYEESRELAAGCQEDLQAVQELLRADGNVDFEIRDIEGLFVFTKSAEPEQTVCRLQEYLEGGRLDVFSNGKKVYAVPKALSKGEAVRRFRRRLQGDAGSGKLGSPIAAGKKGSSFSDSVVVAAGDSRFDISMLEAADVALAEQSLKLEGIQGEHVVYLGEEGIFSDEVLEYIWNIYYSGS
ncbi:HAD family hydrolase [Lachnospiraceae bacterium JLR.KK009]